MKRTPTYAAYLSSPRRSAVNRARNKRLPLIVLAVVIVLLGSGSAWALNAHHKPAAKSVAVSTTKKPTTQKKPAVNPAKPAPTPTPAPAVAAPVTACSQNTLDKFIAVSITKRHMWLCAGSTVAYDAPVVTGMQNLAADLTPPGTYHVYSKQTNLTLSGSDSTGSWNDPVSYWMPFLSNQYGIYGFHDATWRDNNDFGNIDPYSDKGSHGCVELPLAAAQYLYNWAPVGTTLTVTL